MDPCLSEGLVPSPIKVDIKDEVHEPLSVAFTEAASVLSDDELPVCDLVALSEVNCENPMQSVESFQLDFPAIMTPLTNTTSHTPGEQDGLLTDDEDDCLAIYSGVNSPISSIGDVNSQVSASGIDSPDVLFMEYTPSSSKDTYLGNYPDPLQLSKNNRETKDDDDFEDDDDDDEEEEFKYTCKDCGMSFAKSELYEIHLSGEAQSQTLH